MTTENLNYQLSICKTIRGVSVVGCSLCMVLRTWSDLSLWPSNSSTQLLIRHRRGNTRCQVRLKRGVVCKSFLKNLRYVFRNCQPARVSVRSETGCFITDESLLHISVVVCRPTCPVCSTSALTYPDIAWTSCCMVACFDVPQVRATFIIRVEDLPWSWKQQIPLKHETVSTKLRDVTSRDITSVTYPAVQPHPTFDVVRATSAKFGLHAVKVKCPRYRPWCGPEGG